MDLKWERKIYEIVLEAQEKSDADLPAFLNAACAGDPLALQEVQRRLRGIKQVLENAKKLLD